ncbi:hypothetical protein D9Q98_001092 [Chlorella vulgaris]|uniref:Uncharacterized protein n=1 Tax=Chlorella vulgaris TaxID=3077 RepID=A0A9D4Z331_CHLVU|nr:hypothetical protein D9Q98_001092 [Chlorella vulgaris]
MTKAIIPSNDPARLARMQNEKLRMVGVDKAALDAQVREKREAEERERAADRAAAATTISFTAQLVQQEVVASQARRMQDRGVDAFRHQQEAERRQREAQARHEEAAAAAAEQAANLASPWLNEAPERGVSALAPHRVRPDHFKAFPPHQTAAILTTQAQQVEAKRVAEEQAAAEQAAFEAQAAGHAAEAERQAAAADVRRWQAAQEVLAVQQRQAEEAFSKEAELRAHLNSQQPTAAYFAQWGTSHR